MSKIPVYSQSSRRHVRAIAVMAAFFSLGLAAVGSAAPAAAQETKPNILFIMGDDIGWMQPSIYHRASRSVKRPISIASAMKARSS